MLHLRTTGMGYGVGNPLVGPSTPVSASGRAINFNQMIKKSLALYDAVQYTLMNQNGEAVPGADIFIIGKKLDWVDYSGVGEVSGSIMFNYSPSQGAQGSGGYDWGYAGNVLGAGGTAYAGLENAIANKYWWMDANGNYKSTKILQKGANGKYVRGVQGLRNGYNSALKAASGYKVAGNVVGGLGLLVTGAQLYNNQITATEASIDAAFGVIGFFGPIGAGISATYFIGKLGYEYFSGNTVFEKPR